LGEVCGLWLAVVVRLGSGRELGRASLGFGLVVCFGLFTELETRLALGGTGRIAWARGGITAHAAVAAHTDEMKKVGIHNAEVY
jgi:hypothetical protein